MLNAWKYVNKWNNRDDIHMKQVSRKVYYIIHMIVRFILIMRYRITDRRFVTALHGMQTRSYDEISVRLSICPSVCLSNACIVTKRKKDMFRFLYHTKEHLS